MDNDIKTKNFVNNFIWEDTNSTEAMKNFLNKEGADQNVTIYDTENAYAKKQCSVIGKISGIYKIINKVNGKYYIGSSININKGYKCRWNRHRCSLRNNKHPNSHLQNAWNKYGHQSFDFVIVEKVDPDPELLLKIEQQYLDIAATEQNRTYNLCFSAENPTKLCLESKEKIASKLRIYYSTPEMKKKMSIINKGRKCSEEHKNILRIKNTGPNSPRFGKMISDEEREKRIDQRIFNFRNSQSGEVFTGRAFDFYKKYSLSKDTIWKLISGKYGVKSVHKWILV